MKRDEAVAQAIGVFRQRATAAAALERGLHIDFIGEMHWGGDDESRVRSRCATAGAACEEVGEFIATWESSDPARQGKAFEWLLMAAWPTTPSYSGQEPPFDIEEIEELVLSLEGEENITRGSAHRTPSPLRPKRCLFCDAAPIGNFRMREQMNVRPTVLTGREIPKPSKIRLDQPLCAQHLEALRGAGDRGRVYKRTGVRWWLLGE